MAIPKWAQDAIELCDVPVEVDLSKISKFGLDKVYALPLDLNESAQLHAYPVVQKIKGKNRWATMFSHLSSWRKMEKGMAVMNEEWIPFEVWQKIPTDITNLVINEVSKALTGKGAEDFLDE